MEPNPNVIGSRISQKTTCSVPIFDLSFYTWVTRNYGRSDFSPELERRLETKSSLQHLILNLAYHGFSQPYKIVQKYLSNI